MGQNAEKDKIFIKIGANLLTKNAGGGGTILDGYIFINLTYYFMETGCICF